MYRKRPRTAPRDGGLLQGEGLRRGAAATRSAAGGGRRPPCPWPRRRRAPRTAAPRPPRAHISSPSGVPTQTSRRAAPRRGFCAPTGSPAPPAPRARPLLRAATQLPGAPARALPTLPPEAELSLTSRISGSPRCKACAHAHTHLPVPLSAPAPCPALRCTFFRVLLRPDCDPSVVIPRCSSPFVDAHRPGNRDLNLIGAVVSASVVSSAVVSPIVVSVCPGRRVRHGGRNGVCKLPRSGKLDRFWSQVTNANARTQCTRAEAAQTCYQ